MNRDILRKINAIEIDGVRLSERKIFGDYNVWQFYQYNLLFRDIPSLKSVRRSGSTDFSYFFFAVFAMVISALALIWAGLTGKRILIYTTDKVSSAIGPNDFRMDPIYESLREKRSSYLEVVHTLGGKSMLQSFFKRGRLVVYLEAIEILYRLTHPSRKRVKVDGEFGSLVEKYLLQIPVSEFKVKFFLSIFKLLGTQKVFSIDDSRYYHELMLAAELANINSYAFQHGMYDENFVGFLKQEGFTGRFAAPKKLFVWSEYWKQELERLGTYIPGESIKIGGFPKPVPLPVLSAAPDHLSILIPCEPLVDMELLSPYLRKIEASNAKVFLKVRPDLAVEDQIKPYGLKNARVIRTLGDEMGKVGVILGAYSTFLFDCVAYERPVVRVEGGVDFGRSIVENDLAEDLQLTDHFADDLKRIQKTSKSILQKRREKLFGKNPGLMTDTVRALLSS